MSNSEAVISEGSADAKFPEADADVELLPGNTDSTSLQEDSVSAQITTSKEIKAEADKKDEEKKEDVIHKVKSTFVISGVIVAVIGAIFAVTKKLRESQTPAS